jgi:hypothetical protein
MSRSELFHVGIVVRDLEAAVARFTDLLGITWGPLQELEASQVSDGAGNDFVVPLRVRCSTQAPYLELIEEVPGTEWTCNEHSNLHHIAFWSDALTADSQLLTSAKCPVTVSGRRGTQAPSSWVYHQDALGVRIELVDDSMRSAMEQTIFAVPKST